MTQQIAGGTTKFQWNGEWRCDEVPFDGLFFHRRPMGGHCGVIGIRVLFGCYRAVQPPSTTSMLPVM